MESRAYTLRAPAGNYKSTVPRVLQLYESDTVIPDANAPMTPGNADLGSGISVLCSGFVPPGFLSSRPETSFYR